MFGRIIRAFKGGSASASASDQGGPRAIGISDDGFALPVWFDYAPSEPAPATYDGVFWDIEPMGEYIFHLAGDFARTEAGLLRFGTAPLELRAERCFEQDVFDVVAQDGLNEQVQGASTVAGLSDIADLTVGAAVDVLLGRAQDLGFERWVTSSSGRETDMRKGVSRVALGQHFRTSAPYLEVIFQQLHLPTQALPRASVVTVTANCTDAAMRIGDIVEMHARCMETYRDMPAIPLSGATRM